MKTIWVSSSFLRWDVSASGWSPVSTSAAKQPYVILSHSADLLKRHSGVLFRVDAVLAMKRALDVRLKRLNHIYSFDRLCGKDIPKHIIQKLEYYGVVRPLMLRKLMDVRNTLEHGHKRPPTAERCEEFHEFVWYFLRSTEGIASWPVDGFEFRHPVHWANYEIICEKDRNWTFRLRGWLTPDMVSMTSRKGWACFSLMNIKTRQEVRHTMTKAQLRMLPEKLDERGRMPDDVYVEMRLKLQEENPIHHQLVRRLFEVH